MLIKIITLKFDSVLEKFDDEPLQEFIRDKAVLSIRDHFFINNESPYLAIIVTYKPCDKYTSDAEPAKKPASKSEPWRKLINENNMPMFNTMRTWRNERAKSEGIAPYIICNNTQLAQIVKQSPQTLAALADIQGFGKTKIQKYGQEIVSFFIKPHKNTEANGGVKENDEKIPAAATVNNNQSNVFDVKADINELSKK